MLGSYTHHQFSPETLIKTNSSELGGAIVDQFVDADLSRHGSDGDDVTAVAGQHCWQEGLSSLQSYLSMRNTVNNNIAGRKT